MRPRTWPMIAVFVFALILFPHEVKAATDCNSVTQISVAECEALVTLYNGTDGPNWTRQEGWLDTNTPCSWFGVRCMSGHVNQINLSENQLSGAVPSAISSLTSLQFLYLHTNQLSGVAPEIGQLTSLRLLNISNNQFSSIPAEVGNLSNLVHLVLAENQLTIVPPEVGNLTNLELLHLAHNNLSSLPTEIGNLASLQNLFVGVNPDLTGALPASLTQLTELRAFSFTGTDLCEPGDAEFQNWLDSVPDVSSTNVICGSPAPPTATAPLRLSLFATEPVAGGVTLRWETEAEADNVGFNLYRLEADGAMPTKVNAELIPAQGNATAGAAYELVDRPGSGTFVYLIKNVDSQGVEHLRGQVEEEATGFGLYLPLLNGG